MKVELLTNPASIKDMERFAAIGALTCHANTDKDFVPDEVLTRIIKAGHESILEHINLTYSIKGLSRACLQELARHRHISLSVESTRHTLRKNFGAVSASLPKEYSEYLFVLWCKLRDTPNTPNDELKYLLPEFWPTNLVLTSNVRELRHIEAADSPGSVKGV